MPPPDASTGSTEQPASGVPLALHPRHGAASAEDAAGRGQDDGMPDWGAAKRAQHLDHLAQAVVVGVIDPRQAAVAGGLLVNADTLLARQHTAHARVRREQAHSAGRQPSSGRPPAAARQPEPTAPEPMQLAMTVEIFDKIFEVLLERAPDRLDLIEHLLTEAQMDRVRESFQRGREAHEHAQTFGEAPDAGPAGEGAE